MAVAMKVLSAKHSRITRHEGRRHTVGPHSSSRPILRKLGQAGMSLATSVRWEKLKDKNIKCIIEGRSDGKTAQFV